jgi:hypothetical protein
MASCRMVIALCIKRLPNNETVTVISSCTSDSPELWLLHIRSVVKLNMFIHYFLKI